MPQVDRDGVTLNYGSDGSGDTVVFLPEAGLGAWSWGWQHAAVAGPFESLVVDPRGTGQSDAPPGPYELETLADDLEAVLRDADAPRVNLVGCGLGGAVALTYARAHGRARSLTLVNIPGSGDEVDADAYGELFGDGWPAVAFSDDYRSVAPLEDIETWRRTDDAGSDARAAQLAAYREFEPGPLYEHDLPTLVLGATESPVVDVEACERLADGLPRGEFERVEGRHLAHVEHSVAVNDRLLEFLEEP